MLIVFTIMGVLAATGGAYAVFIETVAFILNVLVSPTIVTGDIPASLASTDSLTQTITAGVLSWQALILALLIGVFVFLGTAAAAYTKALALGVISRAVDGEKANFIDMFRAGRQYWWPVMRYYAPFALLIWIALLIVLPLLTYMLGYVVATQGLSARMPIFFYVLVLVGAVFLLLRVATIFAESIILDGSRRPIKDSIRFSSSNAIETLKVIALLAVVAIVIWLVNEGVGWIEGQSITVISLLATIFGVLVYALWRLWVAAFVVCVWRSRNLKQRMPRV
jgi:hypothetical protein